MRYLVCSNPSICKICKIWAWRHIWTNGDLFTRPRQWWSVKMFKVFALKVNWSVLVTKTASTSKLSTETWRDKKASSNNSTRLGVNPQRGTQGAWSTERKRWPGSPDERILKGIVQAITISLSASIYHCWKSPPFWDHDRRFRTSWWLVDQVQQLTFKGWLIWAALIPLMATRAETWESTSGQNSIPSQARLSKCCLEQGADLKRNFANQDVVEHLQRRGYVRFRVIRWHAIKIQRWNFTES